jgi:thiol-disulfide isomerase/thioredoxin
VRLSFILPVLVLAAPLSAASVPALAAAAPHVRIARSSQLATPLPYPYDETADARAAIRAAFARARQNGKRVLIDFGGNWCPDCRILAGVMALPEVAPFLAAHFELVTVDVGRFKRNLDVAKAYGAPKIAGVPFLVIARPDGKVLVASYAVTDEHHTKPQQMVDWLAAWAK